MRIRVAEKRFEGPEGAVTALRDVDVTLGPRERLAVIGPSGAGKSTLLNIAAGLDRDFQGALQGFEALRIGVVFQTPRLLPWRTARENIALASGADPAAVEALGAEMGLSGFLDRHPGKLSVGMARRVALARAFAARPDMLMMDEPFVSLDPPMAARLRALTMARLQEAGAGLVFVTHDLDEALALAERVLVLKAGRLIAERRARDAARGDLERLISA